MVDLQQIGEEIALLERRRAALTQRIKGLRPHAFRRLELSARQAEITRRLLELEMLARRQRELADDSQLKWWQR
jgi:hypothetical protein